MLLAWGVFPRSLGCSSPYFLNCVFLPMQVRRAYLYIETSYLPPATPISNADISHSFLILAPPSLRNLVLLPRFIPVTLSPTSHSRLPFPPRTDTSHFRLSPYKPQRFHYHFLLHSLVLSSFFSPLLSSLSFCSPSCPFWWLVVCFIMGLFVEGSYCRSIFLVLFIGFHSSLVRGEGRFPISLFAIVVYLWCFYDAALVYRFPLPLLRMFVFFGW